MRTISRPTVINPTMIVLALLAAGIVFVGTTGKDVPLLSDARVDIILLVLLGMTICSEGGIGRIAATNEWSHPRAIVGYVLGAAILLITVAVFAGWKLPLLQTDQQALIAIAILAAIKIWNAVTHFRLSRS